MGLRVDVKQGEGRTTLIWEQVGWRDLTVYGANGDLIQDEEGHESLSYVDSILSLTE